jgi:hypothetical protein
LGGAIRSWYEEGVVVDDDVVVVVDADEIINETTLRKLKEEGLHDDTIAEAHLLWNLYNRCWVHGRKTRVTIAASILTLRTTFAWDTHLIRATRTMSIVPLHDAGYHCSWCFFTPDQFREKIKFMTDGDATPYPRYQREAWPDSRIRRFMDSGLWLDGNVHGKYVC